MDLYESELLLRQHFELLLKMDYRYDNESIQLVFSEFINKCKTFLELKSTNLKLFEQLERDSPVVNSSDFLSDNSLHVSDISDEIEIDCLEPLSLKYPDSIEYDYDEPSIKKNSD